ncbi:acyltransferase [Exiguobacterium sp. s193]|uniref:acyltransferase n=1 Tax=Exiguobacterium sp. s193 TaxID=2751207 RepID=UPI001BE989AF|nr:acyltransferase [Exiguobacterium sp. s193]
MIDLIKKVFLKVSFELATIKKVKKKSSYRIHCKTRVNGKGLIYLGKSSSLGYYLASSVKREILLQARNIESKIVIGGNSTIGNGSEIIAISNIEIGENCLLGPRVIIYDSDFHGVNPTKRNNPITKPVFIHDNVWIGTEAIILKGVTIEQDSVIGARTVVTKNVPKGSIVSGNPMRIIGSVYDS